MHDHFRKFLNPACVKTESDVCFSGNEFYLNFSEDVGAVKEFAYLKEGLR